MRADGLAGESAGVARVLDFGSPHAGCAPSPPPPFARHP